MRTPFVRGTAIIMELKVAKNFEDMEKECEAVLSQIEERNYVAALHKEGFRDFIKYGICFYRKECLIRI